MSDPGWWGLVATQVLASGSALVVASVALRFDRRRSMNEALVARRIALYDDVVPRLNDLLCFFLLVGDWRSFPPPAMIAHKRALDRTLHVWGALFPPDMSEAWHVFSRCCFATHNGPGRAARLRADPARLAPHWGARWEPDWNDCLAPAADAADPDSVRAAYDAVVAALADAIGVRRARPRRATGTERPGALLDLSLVSFARLRHGSGPG